MRSRRRLPLVLAALPVIAACAAAAAPRATSTPPAAPPPPATQGAPAAPSPAEALACTLLTSDEVRAVQGSVLVDTKGSDGDVPGGRRSRCFLRTQEFARSVSVDVVLPQRGRSPLAGGVRAISPRERWQSMFHRQPAAHDGDADRGEREEEEHGNAPLAVAHLGDEAFWVDTGMTGALYVLRGDAYLRLSVGGPGDSGVRLQRSRALAQDALPRLAAALRSH